MSSPLLASLFSGGIPRRAVVVHGIVKEKFYAPEADEIEHLSVVFEHVRRMNGGPVHSRATTELLQQCITCNDADAWRAMFMDLKTEDINFAETKTYFDMHPTKAADLVRCAVAAQNGAHFVSIMCTLSALLTDMHPEARHYMATALAQQIFALVNAVRVHGGVLGRDIRDSVLSWIGKLVVDAKIPDREVLSIIDDTLKRGEDDVLRLFVHCDIQMDQDMCMALLRRARSAPIHARYGPLVLLAKAARKDPRVFADKKDHLKACLEQTCTEMARDAQLDPRLALAVSVLAGHVDDSLVTAMACIMEQCAAAALKK